DETNTDKLKNYDFKEITDFTNEKSGDTVALDHAATTFENIEVVSGSIQNEIQINAMNSDPIITVPLIEVQNNHVVLELTINSPLANFGQIFWKSNDDSYEEV